MTQRHRPEPRAVAAELEALIRAGDHREASRRARRALSEEGTREADRAAARSLLARLRPERGAVLAAVCGLALLIAVALLGLAAR